MSDAATGAPQPSSPRDEPVGYPRHWEADVVLRDGGTARVRPIRGEDADRLQAFHVRQSERSTYFRFFAPLERLPERDLTRFTQVDHHDRVALVAVADEDDGERIIAVARYERTGPGEAEVAFNVADDHHGRGLGSVLLEHIAAAARERGIRRFTAEVLPQNGAMLAVFRVAGYDVTQHLDDGIVTVSVDLDPTERSIAVMADREHRAEARSMRTLLTPASVLVVTDSGPTTRTRALAVVGHLLGAGLGDEAAPVRRPAVHAVGLGDAGAAGERPVTEGVTHWPDVAAVPGPVDLLVLAVAAQDAAAVVRRCAPLRAHAVVVLSDGFAETGPDGLVLQRELVRVAHGVGMRVLGPSSFGFFRHGTGDEPTVNASLAAVLPQPGTLALFCQSAPLAVGLLASARRRHLGLSTFVSSGNRADVSGNDVMQFLTEDDATAVVCLYLESIGNPRKFTRVARRLAAAKPVVVLTAGRSGHVVPAGHAVRTTRVPRRALEEILSQAGVVRVDSQHALLDVAQLLVHQPLPAGRRVSVLAGSEPLAALVAEAAASAGLSVVDRRAILAAGESGDEVAHLDATLAEVYADPSVDAVVVVHVPTLGPPDPGVARAVARAAARSGRTTVACVLGLSGVTPELTAPDADGVPRTVPAYAAPEDGVVALAAASRYASWRARDHGQPLDPPGVDRARARRLVLGALEGVSAADAAPATDVGDDGGATGTTVGGEGGVRLDAATTAELLACYGVEVWPTRRVRDADEAVAAAEELGWPVAIKSTVAHLRHRIDLGGVRLDVPGPAALREAFAQMRAQLGAVAAGRPFEVQRMARNGAACVIRSTEDPRFGPVLSFGIAGDAVDLLGDVAHAVAPLTDVDVADMVRGVRASPRLFGYRGLPALDVAALEDLLGRVAVLADDLPEVRSLELHPVLVAEQGVAVLAARVAVGPAGRADAGRRALPQ